MVHCVCHPSARNVALQVGVQQQSWHYFQPRMWPPSQLHSEDSDSCTWIYLQARGDQESILQRKGK